VEEEQEGEKKEHEKEEEKKEKEEGEGGEWALVQQCHQALAQVALKI
jgi:hypothetical protein